MNVRSRAPLLAIVSALSVIACAGSPPPSPVPSPADLPALEAAQQQSPRDAALITRLGIAYFEAKRFDRSRDVLQSALALNGRNYPALVYLGLAHEELGSLDSARAAFTAAGALAGGKVQQGEIADRLALLTRKELRQAARAAIAQEATLSAQPPTENSVAVFPFSYVGQNEDLRPVGRGLTHLMITDLSKLSRLKLLEREQVQLLVDEMALNDAGRVDPRTGARSGRILRAERVVQGSVQDVPGKQDIRLDAAIVNASDAKVVASGTGSDPLAQLFALQKQVLFRLVDQLGITLTPAERRALSERPTADLQAFLAFSRGLEAEDRGDYQAAEANYSAALARDPNFRAAKDRRASNSRLSLAGQLSPQVLAGLGDRDLGPRGGEPVGGVAPPLPTGHGTVLRTGVLYTSPSTGGTLTTRFGGGSGGGPISRPPGTRPQLPETLGGDNAGTPGGLLGTIIIVIVRP
jgi:TolB-like protein